MDFVLFLLLVSAHAVQSSHHEYEAFVTLDVASMMKEDSEKVFKSEKKNPAAANDQSLTLDIMHRDALISPLRRSNTTRQELLLQKLNRDESRISSIYERIQTAETGQKPTRKQRNLLTGPVSSGLSLGIGEYFVRLGVGTPASMGYMEVDTGSDVTWVQCAPCTSCYSQADPIYDPRNSTTYRQVYCGSLLCQALDFSGCQGFQCVYQVVYGDRSSTSGDLAMEAFSMNGSLLRTVVFGCGHTNTGLFQGQAGLIGMGGGTLSFISQLGPSVGNVFSYCLVNRASTVQTTSPLIIGQGAVPLFANFTPLIRNPRISTFYYGMLTGISVGGVLLPIPSSAFQLSMNGSGGVIFDSGTSVTRIVSSAYSILRDAYRSASINLPPAPAAYLLDTCYNFFGIPTVQIPSLVLHFQNGVDMALPGSNILIPVDQSGTFCLAFAASTMPISVIGNIQQQTFRIGYDLQRSLLSITPRQC